MHVCKYAGDVNDSGCKDCDGVDTDCTEYSVQETPIGASDTSPNAPGAVNNASGYADTTAPQKTSVEVESGVSVDIKGTWYRFGIKIGKDLISNSPEQLQTQIDALWSAAHEEIDKQIVEAQGG